LRIFSTKITNAWETKNRAGWQNRADGDHGDDHADDDNNGDDDNEDDGVDGGDS
jgi:hypothetical protein